MLTGTELYDQLNEIQNKVYTHFQYETDQELYDTVEKWVLPEDAYKGTTSIIGDCEDFALACRKLCREAGLQTRLVVCVVQEEGHCVLECNGWIFDCNYKTIRSNTELAKEGYEWVCISGYEPGDPWHFVKK